MTTLQDSFDWSYNNREVGSGDLHQSRHITFKTIRRIGELLGKAG